MQVFTVLFQERHLAEVAICLAHQSQNCQELGYCIFRSICLPLSLKNHSKQPTSTCTLTKPVDSRSHIGLLQPLQHIHCTSHIHKLKIHKLYNACWTARSKHAYGQKHAWEKSPVNFPLI